MYCATDVGGIQFSSSIETQNIRSGPGNSLSISSPVGNLRLNGPQKLDFVSFGGSISLYGLEDITLATKGQGKVVCIGILTHSRRCSFLSLPQITLNSGALKMPNLILTNLTSSSYFRKKTNTNTYQLCSCSDGKLFMAEPNSLCLADYHICASA